jgi:hypothetical protein
MGLDMYLYKVKKMKEEAAKVLNNLTSEQIREKYPNALIFGMNNEEEARLYEALLPYAQKVMVINRYLNLEKMKKDYDIPNDAYINGEGWTTNEVHYSFYDNASKKSFDVKMTIDELDKKYGFDETDEQYIVKEIEEVYYWRKAYKIQDFFYENHPVENCGYYLTSKDELEDLVDYATEIEVDEDDYDNSFDISRIDLVDDDNEEEAIFYHEWY